MVNSVGNNRFAGFVSFGRAGAEGVSANRAVTKQGNTGEASLQPKQCET